MHSTALACREPQLYKTPKAVKKTMLGAFGRTFFEAPNWTIKTRKAFPCSVALIPFCAGAFPCSVALVFLFWVTVPMVQHGRSQGVKNTYKTNAILLIFKMKGTPGAATKWIP